MGVRWRHRAWRESALSARRV